MKQKQQKRILGHGTGHAKLLTWGMLYFCAESAPNPLSFAPRLNLSNIRS